MQNEEKSKAHGEGFFERFDEMVKVFPLKFRQKVPTTPNGFHDAVPPYDADWAPNMGWVLGGQPYFAIDVDVKGDHHGATSLCRFLGYLLPVDYTEEQAVKVLVDKLDTLIIKTPTNGLHIVFRHEEGFVADWRRMPRGCEFRGSVGYLVAPGAHLEASADPKGRNVTGDYTVIKDMPVARAPARIVAELTPYVEEPLVNDGARHERTDCPEAIAAAEDFVKGAKPAVGGTGLVDEGYDWSMKVARRLYSIGVSEDEAHRLMVEHWADRCSPPWEHGHLLKKVYDWYRGCKGKHGRDMPGEDDSGSAEDAEQVAKALGTPPESTAPVSKVENLVSYADEFDEPVTNPFTLVRVSKERAEQVAWHIEGLLPEGRAGLIYGDEQVLKSFIAVKMGVDLAMDCVKHHGDSKQKGIEYPIVNHGPVIFIATEDYIGIDTRSREAILDRDPDADPSKVPFFLLDGAPNMTNPGEVDMLIKAIEAATNGKPPVAVFIDTAVFAMGESDEDKAKDVKKAYEGAKTIIRHFDGKPSVFYVHHTGKDISKGARGSSNWTRSSEVRYLVKGIGQIEVKEGHRVIKYPVSVTAYNEKMKGQALQPPISYKTRRIVFDVDKTVNGKKTTGKDSTLLLDVVPYKEAAQAAGIMSSTKIVRLMLDKAGAGKELTPSEVATFANNENLLAGSNTEGRHAAFKRLLQDRMKSDSPNAAKFREAIHGLYKVTETLYRGETKNAYHFLGQGGSLGEWEKFKRLRAKEQSLMEKAHGEDSETDNDEDFGDV